MPNLLRVRLSLKGRPIRTFTFDKKDVSIRRDPTCDICLDNAGISRHHARIERTPGGYVVEDMGSANGTFLNDTPVRKDFVGHDDVIQIGKFALWVGVETDRRDKNSDESLTSPAAYEGTVVLDPEALLEMQRKSRTDAPALEDPLRKRPAVGLDRPVKPWMWLVVAAAFAVGAFVGTVVLRMLGG